MSFHRVKYATNFDNDITVNSNIIVTGTVDGVDISAFETSTTNHINDLSIHRQINDLGTGATELWSASKISTELSGLASSSHTHVVTDITDFDTGVDARITLQKGVANGLCDLDGSGKVPASRLSLSNVLYIGIWDASTNTPTLASGVGTQGNYYVVGTVGSTNIDGITDWKTGDWIIFNGTVWEKSDHTDSVTSVAGKQGVVTLQLADITDLSSTTDLTEGTNLYYTESRVTNNTTVQSNLTHTSLTNNPHSVTKAQVGLSNVDNTLNNFGATTPPAVSDDNTSGYSIGSHWIDVSNDVLYVCVDDTTGNAVWLNSSSGGVTSVNGFVGAVTLDTDNINEGSSNLYYTETRVTNNTTVQANLTHTGLTNNPHSVTKTQIGLSNVENILNNYGATTNPTVSDDNTGGYGIGSRWVNTSLDVEFVCLDTTTGNAVWKRTVDEDDEDNVVEFFDDFVGSEISLQWINLLNGGTSDACIVDGVGGVVQLTSGPVATFSSELSFGNKTIDKSFDTTLKFRLKQNSITQTKIEFGTIIDGNNLVQFIYDKTTTGGNWESKTISSGTATTNDTLFSADTSYHVFEIKYFNTSIEFYVDGVLKTTHSTNLPSGLMNVYMKQTSNDNISKNIQVDFVKINGQR